MQALELLKNIFGYTSFRKGQEKVVTAILKGQDALAIMPTGAGKSICYQIPALMLPGVTLVVSPLIALMQDQVKSLVEAGVKAAYINSSLTEGQLATVYARAAAGAYKIIYVAPERLETYGLRQMAEQLEISMITVDEAHCISQWGQDFRPSYMKIVDFVGSLPYRPVISAFTATATREVKDDIMATLALRQPELVVTGFDRDNLYYRVEHLSGRKKDDFLLAFLQEHHGESGIIYCATRKATEAVYQLLGSRGAAVTRYHAGLAADERRQNQEAFIYDRAPVVVATNAFGMGIDKSNVRWVIHYNMPQSMEAYYQEAGRAGRDGEPAQCILLYGVQDVMTARYLIEHREGELSPEEEQELVWRDMQRLHKMEAYCTTTGCLRNYILNYFGEQAGEPCQDCGNCQQSFVAVEMTEAARQVLRCVWELPRSYAQGTVIQVLRGGRGKRLQEIGAAGLSSYGSLREMEENALRQLIAQLVQDGFLLRSQDRLGVLSRGSGLKRLGEGCQPYLVQLRPEDVTEIKQRPSRRRQTLLTGEAAKLFEALRQKRLELAQKSGVPPYVVFSDKTLHDMCAKQPRSKEEMLEVAGVGAAKLARYGKAFLAVLEDFRRD